MGSAVLQEATKTSRGFFGSGFRHRQVNEILAQTAVVDHGRQNFILVMARQSMKGD
jgi:hypothetical protein